MALVKDCLKNITAFVRASSWKSDKFKMNGGKGAHRLFVSTLGGFPIKDAFKIWKLSTVNLSRIFLISFKVRVSNKSINPSQMNPNYCFTEASII